MSFVHIVFFSIVVFIMLLLSQFHFHFHFHFLSGNSYSSNKYLHYYWINTTTSYHHMTYRRLLFQGPSCTSRDLSISQSKGSTSGIPQYIVQIVNTCASQSGCAPSNIHLHCGWFASARIVNPRFFKRLAYDDCLVNGGHTLRSGQMISFSYSNSFMYPISLKHATFC